MARAHKRWLATGEATTRAVLGEGSSTALGTSSGSMAPTTREASSTIAWMVAVSIDGPMAPFTKVTGERAKCTEMGRSVWATVATTSASSLTTKRKDMGSISGRMAEPIRASGWPGSSMAWGRS